MSRIKQIQIIDNVIHSVTIIAESQCSLLGQDRNVLNEALEKLQYLKQKKGKTNKQIQQEVEKVVRLLVTFLAKPDVVDKMPQ